MGWRRIEPDCDESGCFFPATTALAGGSPLDAWVPYAAPPPGASHERVDTGVGRLSLAARATELGGGWYRYDYALANHDLDARVRSIRVPLPPGTSVANAGYANGEDGAWSVSTVAGGVLFEAAEPAVGAALDWGWAASFRFDADAPPGEGSVDLGVLEGDPALRLAASATTPGGALGAAIFADGFEGGTGRWAATP
jgi:hypothetical protein